MGNVFVPADILIPCHTDMHKWSVVACDQYTSQPEYWEELENLVGQSPSTLRLMLPEAYLGKTDTQAAVVKINQAMREYLRSGVFQELKRSFILVRRTLASGKMRTGLVGAVDLEQYDFSPESVSPIRATEGTVPSRLPPRVKVREGACLEMPHIMIFMNDPQNKILTDLFSSIEKSGSTPVYDFSLNGHGGYLKGYAVTGSMASFVSDEVSKAADSGGSPVILAVGDGNHSLATAKVCWERIKSGLSEEEKEHHPARFCLAEVVNIHDEAITFEPIHRVIFGTDPKDYFSFMRNELSPAGNEDFSVSLLSGDRMENLTIQDQSIGSLISRCEAACSKYTEYYGGSIDYIHNDDTAADMSRSPGCCALLLPPMRKDQLFRSVQETGPFPKKSFSIGLAQDKRYYLECRAIAD